MVDTTWLLRFGQAYKAVLTDATLQLRQQQDENSVLYTTTLTALWALTKRWAVLLHTRYQLRPNQQKKSVVVNTDMHVVV